LRYRREDSLLTISRLLRHSNKLFGLAKLLKRIRDKRLGTRVELPGARLLVGLLTAIWGRARSLRAATARPGGVLSEPKLCEAVRPRGERQRRTLADASTLYEYLQQVTVGHLERTNVQVCKQLKTNRAVLFEGSLAAGLDATGIPTPTDLYKDEGALSQTRRKKDREGKEVEYKVYFYLLSNLCTVGGAMECYLGYQVAQVGHGEAEASRQLLTWARSKQVYGARFIDVLLGDALYCNQVDLGHFKKTATTGWMVRANECVGAVADAKRLLHLGERLVCTVKGDRTVVRAVPLVWPEVGQNLRLVESTQDGGEPLLFVTNLLWLLDKLARLGRARWGIENNLHKEIKHEWPFLYLPSRTLHGLKAWWWLIALAFNLFHAFFDRQVQPRLRANRFPTLRAAFDYLHRHLLEAALRRVIIQEGYG
jgi:hypothetical protein